MFTDFDGVCDIFNLEYILKLFRKKIKGEVGHIYGVKTIINSKDIIHLKAHLDGAKEGENIPEWVDDDLQFMNEQLNGLHTGEMKTLDSAQLILHDYIEKFHP